MSAYIDYYKNVITNYNTGFKLVLGGTGLGKTSGIVNIIQETVKNTQKSDNRKFVYIANRVQLLNELKNELPQDIVCHQESNLEIVLSNRLSEELIEKFIEADIPQKYIAYIQSIDRESNSEQILQEYQFISSFSKNIKEDSNERLKEMLNQSVSKFLTVFKKLLKIAFKVKSEKIDIKNCYTTDYEKLINEPLIKILFPYSEFKYDDKKEVLLVTIQKAFHGFFDGKKTVNLFNLDNSDSREDVVEGNGGHIIFFDEFDFLESDLLDLVCQDVEIQQPFKFVAEFFNAMYYDKLPSDNFLNDYPQVKKEILKIIKNILSLEEYGIDFPRITHFVSLHDFKINQRIKEIGEELDKIRGNRKARQQRKGLQNEIKTLSQNRISQKSIFQTRFSVTSTKLFLDNTRDNSFDLTPDEDRDLPSALILLNVVNQSAAQIIRLFKKLENEDFDLYNQMIRYCYKKSEYKNDIKYIKQYPHKRRKTNTVYDKIQYNGFGLYEIQDFSETNDPEEVSLKYYMLFTTPEKILLHLTKHNLVFGLSATSNIQRLVKNFDVNWLSSQLGNNYYDLTEYDIKLIKKANQKKQNLRNNNVFFHKAELLGSSKYQQELLQHIVAIAKVNDEIFGKNPKYRIRRVNYFFSTLLWISKTRKQSQLETDTHLLFFYTYKQIYHLFKNPQNNEHGLFEIERGGKDDVFPYYYITIQKQKFIIIFYNAEKAKRVTHEKAAKKAYYDIFWERLPVILVTQYASAGNGVNLQYYETEEGFITKNKNERKDFKNIHLLDEPRFYFSKIKPTDKEQDRNANIKKNIYYLAKLLYSKQQVSEDKSMIDFFKGYLDNVRESGKFNGDYLNSMDGLLNQIAVFIQALGRIERVWSSMDDQTIILSADVYSRFKKFIFDYAYIRKQIQEYASNNLNALFEHIKEYYWTEDEDLEEVTEEHLPVLNDKCRKKVSELLYDISLMRKGGLSTGIANQIRKKWNRLRIDALKHDFNTSLMEEYNCVFKTNYIVINEFEEGLKEKTLYINSDTQYIAPFKGADYEEWNLNFPYRNIIRNDVINTYFELHQFEIGFNHHGQFFVPYFHQAILMGAIGEEAIKAIFKKPQTLNPDYQKDNDDVPKFIPLQSKDKIIPLNDKKIPISLFELADTKVEGRAWYIDCKNYSLKTLKNFSILENGKPLHPKLNDSYFAESAILKYYKIQSHYQTEKAKLIYINFIGGENGKVVYYDIIDDNLIPTNLGFEEAKIIVIQGVIKHSNPNELTNEFIKFYKHLNAAYYG